VNKYAQALHDFRAFPRVILLGYAWLVWDVVQWFEALQAPSTQQVVLLTTIVSFSAAIFGFYTTTISGTDKGK
jgi:hypothetical protein